MNIAPYKLERHNDIFGVLQSLDVDYLMRHDVFFGGGTALSLRMNEYRQSVDIDLLCSSLESFRALRNDLSQGHVLSPITKQDLTLLREIKLEKDAVRTAIEYGKSKIKFEIILEGYIPLDGIFVDPIPIAVLSHKSAFAEKLLANADRWHDMSHLSRDIIDIGAMLHSWPDLHDETGKDACELAFRAYGAEIFRAYDRAVGQFENNFEKCCRELSVNIKFGHELLDTLHEYSPELSDEDSPKP